MDKGKKGLQIIHNDHGRTNKSLWSRAFILNIFSFLANSLKASCQIRISNKSVETTFFHEFLVIIGHLSCVLFFLFLLKNILILTLLFYVKFCTSNFKFFNIYFLRFPMTFNKNKKHYYFSLLCGYENGGCICYNIRYHGLKSHFNIQ